MTSHMAKQPRRANGEVKTRAQRSKGSVENGIRMCPSLNQYLLIGLWNELITVFALSEPEIL